MGCYAVTLLCALLRAVPSLKHLHYAISNKKSSKHKITSLVVMFKMKQAFNSLAKVNHESLLGNDTIISDIHKFHVQYLVGIKSLFE